MDTAIKHPVSDRVKPPSFVIFDIRALWASEWPDVKNYKWRLNPVWHRILYSCIHMTTVGVKGLIICRYTMSVYLSLYVCLCLSVSVCVVVWFTCSVLITGQLIAVSLLLMMLVSLSLHHLSSSSSLFSWRSSWLQRSLTARLSGGVDPRGDMSPIFAPGTHYPKYTPSPIFEE